MFTNPFNKKYQNGGSAPTDEQKKEMQEFVTWIKSNVEGFKDKSEQEIAKSLSDMAKSDEGKKSVQDLYSRYQKSKKQKSKFEDGGKFQSFICKHGHGGVNCGCGGGKVITAAGGDRVPKHRYVEREYGPDGSAIYTMAIERSDLPSNMRANPDSDYNQNGGEYQGNGQVRIVDRGIGPEGIAIYSDPYSAINQGRVTNASDSLGYINTLRNLTNRAGIVLGPSFTPSEENGGILMGQDGLSRRQVRQQKREVLRAMNRPTAGAQYEDLVNKTRNWDRFTGMSRLERKNAINQLILNGEKPIVQTPIQPDLGENYVIKETTVPYQFFNPTTEVVETPKVETVITQTQSTPSATTQRSTSTRRSDIAKPEDFPIQEIIIPQMSTNIPFGNGSRTASSNNSTTVATSEQEPVTTKSNSTSTAPIVIDWSKASSWDPYIRMNNGPLSPYQMELIRILTANPNATINDLHGNWTPETFAAVKQKFGFKCGGKVEKHQQEDGVGRGKIKEALKIGLGNLELYTEPSEGTTALRDSIFNYVPPVKDDNFLGGPKTISRVYLQSNNAKEGYYPLTTQLNGKSEFGPEQDFNFLRNVWNAYKGYKNK